MKKTLLVSAFSAIAMVAGAQTEVASAVGEFDFITKNFTVGQKTIPYSLVKDEQNGKYEITFYNTVFNKERTIQVPLKEVKYYPTKTYTASLPVNKITIMESSDYGALYTPDHPLETFDDFAKYIKEKISYNYLDYVPFADAQGNCIWGTIMIIIAMNLMDCPKLSNILDIMTKSPIRCICALLM